MSIGEQASLSVQKLTEMTAAVTKAKTDRIEKEAMFKQLESVKGDRAALESFPAVLANPFVQELRSELIALQRQQAQVAEKFGERHPNRIKINDQVQSADRRLQAEIAKVLTSVRNEFAGARAAEEALDQTLEVQKRDTLSRSGNDVEFVLLQRDAESNRQIWQSLQQRVNEFAVTRERRNSNVSIVDAAEVPKLALAENVRKNLRYGALGAFFLGLCVAFCLEYFDSHVKTPEQIKTELGLPFLGLVPLVNAREVVGSPLVQADTASERAGIPPGFGEAFRKLRTNVRLSIPDERTQPLLITSAGMGEGKTVVASNLATTLALSNQRVLIDRRRLEAAAPPSRVRSPAGAGPVESARRRSGGVPGHPEDEHPRPARADERDGAAQSVRIARIEALQGLSRAARPALRLGADRFAAGPAGHRRDGAVADRRRRRARRVRRRHPAAGRANRGRPVGRRSSAHPRRRAEPRRP